MIKTVNTEELPSYQVNQAYTINKAIHLNLPVAFWKLPESEERHMVIDLNHGALESDFDFENSVPGFVISPFHSESIPKFIKGDIYISSLNNKPVINFEPSPEQKGKITDLFNINFDDNLPPTLPILARLSFISKAHYISIIEKAKKAIHDNQLKKVVVARNKLKNLKSKVDLMSIFNKLCDAYPSAMISLIYHPELGCWIGASPEILLVRTSGGLLKTSALAGTQKVKNQNVLPDMISWQHKEIEEQALVSRYIINCFKSIRLREFEEDGPKTVFSGNLAHLKTDFSINVAEIGIKNLGNTLLKLLHPTSAVGGMPRENAMHFIKENEGFDRSIYSGYIGPVNIKNETSLFVNIRCAQIYQNAALLFAGAGITLGSDPEKEWVETEEKMLFLETQFD